MRAPLSWLAEHLDLTDVDGHHLATALIRVGLEVERVERVGAEISGVVVARVVAVEELAGFKKPIRYCHVDDGSGERGVVCGARNFAAGDLVAFARPGASLPGGVQIGSRKSYGHLSDGMICSGRELGISDDHRGILVLPPDAEVGADVVGALGLADEVLDVAVTPDRGYCLSIRGLAREAAAALDVAFHDPAEIRLPRLDPGGYPATVEDYLGCDRFLLREVEGLDAGATTPAQIARRLTLAGMRPISLAVDVTNYVLLELGQPLHAYDKSLLSGQVVVRRARNGERLVTLDGAERELDPLDLLITDSSGPIGLAGVMGGAGTEVGPTTTSLVIEAAHFDPATIARTARRHKLSSEASRRFERGVDHALPPVAAARAAALLGAHGGGRLQEAGTDIDARPARPRIELALALVGRIAGVDYPPETVRRRLRQVGADVDGPDPVVVTPPTWRPDLRTPIDLVEEVARLEGYERLPALLPGAGSGRGLTNWQRRRRATGRILADAGYIEVRTTPFVSAKVGDALMLPPEDPRRPSVAVRNPLSAEAAMLRASVLPGLFEALLRNIGRGNAEMAVFEIARVFQAGPGRPPAPAPATTKRPSAEELAALDAALPDQPWQVGVVLSGERDRSGWWGPGRAAGWADAIEAVRTVARQLAAPLEVVADTAAPWHPGRCARLLVRGSGIGWAGELHPRVVAAFGLPERTCAAEFALEPLAEAAVDPVPAPRISAFPPAVLDVALVVDDPVPAAEVAGALREGAGELLASLALFDVYVGAQIGPNRKSLAFQMVLRADDRTLTAEEAVRVRDAAVAEASRRFGATLRG